jgi:hypothetical protein
VTSLPPLGPYRRTLGGALVGVVVVVAQVVGWPVHRAGAQAAPAFVPGTANATSQAIQLAPSTGGLGYDMTLAESLAGYQDTEGQAQSQTLDLGAIGLALTTQQCNGSPPPINQSQVPQPVQVESNNGNVNQSKTIQGSDNAGAGVETAAATTTPSGSARTTLIGFSVPGVIDVSGGTSSAGAQLIGNKTREATGSSEIKQISLLAGQVVLDGLQWQSTQRSGDGAAQQGSFSIGSMTLDGKAMQVSPDQLSGSLAQVNQALAPTGFHITPPTATNQSDGSVLERPLSIGIDSSALGQQVVGPGLAAAQPLRDAIASALLGIDCRFAIPLLLADIGIGPLAGGGGLDINLGGATTVTNGTAYGNPFDVNLGGGNSGQSQAGGGGPTGAATAGSDNGLGSSGGALAGQSLAAPAADGARSGSSGGRPLGAVENASSHPGLGAAVPVGAGALALVVVLAAMDYTRARRRRMFAAAEPGP